MNSGGRKLRDTMVRGKENTEVKLYSKKPEKDEGVQEWWYFRDGETLMIKCQLSNEVWIKLNKACSKNGASIHMYKHINFTKTAYEIS